MNINQIKISKSEFEVIKQVTEKTNDYEYIISFNNLDKAEELDELIKDELIYIGFDLNYNPNWFGRNY